MTKLIPADKPTTVILHGANALGVKLTETLTTQQSHVILIDEFNRTTQHAIKTLKENSSADIDIFDMSAVESLLVSLKRVDYIIILLSPFLAANPSISSKKFLSETNVVDALCKLALQQNAKLILVTAIDLHRRLVTETYSSTDTLSGVTAQKPYTTIELQHYCENLVAEYHDQSALNARIARSGELMGEGISLDRDSIFCSLLRESVTKPRITIPGEGLDSAYYVHLLDAVYGIIKALFSNKTSGEVYSLSFPEEISTLNLAYKILEMNPTASEIAFGTETSSTPPSQVYVPAKNLSKLGWSPKIPFDHALHETLNYFFDQYKIEWKERPELIGTEDGIRQTADNTKSKSPALPRSEYVTPLGRFLQSIGHPLSSLIAFIRTLGSRLRNPNFFREEMPKLIFFSALSIFLFFVFFAPLVQVIAGIAGSSYYAKKSYQYAFTLEQEKTESSISRLSYFLDLTQEGWKGLRWISRIPAVEPLYSESGTLLSAANHASRGGSFLIQGAEPYIDYFNNFEPVASFNESAGGGSREYTEELEQMQEKAPLFESASIELSLALELYDDVDTTVFPAFIKDRLDTIAPYTEQAKTLLSTLQSFASRAPDLLGADGRKNYVVVFQNPMELRSTGGWITSIGIVGIEHGQVRKLVVKDVYEIDGQIDQIVTPPTMMKEELDVTDWTLSLSNWSPDFPLTAEAVEYFLSLSEDAVTIDGVFAIDLEFVRSLVDIWKSVEVPGENEAITKDNLHDKVIEIHRSFSPGSTQKPVFLSNLANEILEKTLSSDRELWPQIAEITGKALMEKHILLYFDDPEINSVIMQNKWGGTTDFSHHSVFPVEWNWGGNKANYYISRSTSLAVTIENSSTVHESITVTYENKSTSDQYPEGNYVNFERLYLPFGAKVTEIDGLTMTSVRHDEILGTTLVSGWITVALSSNNSFTIDYTLDKDSIDTFPLVSEPQNKIRYSVTVVKQPGLDEDPITVKISYPSQWTPSDFTNFRRELDTLTSYDELKTDKLISISWAQ